MKKSKLTFIVLSVLIAVLLAGCATGPRVESTAGLSADKSSVYVSYLQFVYKVNQETGAETWRYPAKGSPSIVFFAPPLLSGDAVYVGDLANRFHRLSAETGAEVWTFSGAKGWFQAKAAIDAEQIIAPSNDRNVYSFNTEGEAQWVYEGKYSYLTAPVIVDDLVFISSMDHTVTALNKADGTVVWSTELKGSVVASPYYDAENDLLYVGSIGKEFAALDRETGEIVWTFDASGSLSSVWAAPILVDGNLIFTDQEGMIFSLEPTTGEQRWTVTAGDRVLAGLLALEDGFVVALENGNIRAFDLEKNSLWTRSIEGVIYTTPVLSGGTIVVAASKADALLYAFDTSGNPSWTYKPER